MSQKTVGVLQAFTAPSKLDLLFFDKLVKLEAHEHHLTHDLKKDEIAANFEYLKNIGFVESIDVNLNDLLRESEKKGVDAAPFAKRYNDLQGWAERGPHWTGGRLPPEDSPLPALYAHLARERLRFAVSGMKARLFSLLRGSANEVYTPILRENDESFKASGSIELVQVIINEFPIPNDNVSYEELFEFKNDVTVKRDYELFRRWLRDKLRDESSSADMLREELLDLLSDHREHMRLADLKERSERLYILYTFPLATIERALKLQFSKLLEPVYELRRCRMQLLEAEAKSPGKEVAYIQKATSQFGRAHA